MSKQTIPAEQITLRIRRFRSEKGLLDFDLAALYGVAVKVLNRSVKRNRERFPNDFMSQLSDEETRLLRPQLLALENRGLFISFSVSLPAIAGSYRSFEPVTE